MFYNIKKRFLKISSYGNFMNSDLHLSKKSSRRRFNEGPTCRQSFKLGPNALDEVSYTTHTFVVSLSSLTTLLCGRKCTFLVLGQNVKKCRN